MLICDKERKQPTAMTIFNNLGVFRGTSASPIRCRRVPRGYVTDRHIDIYSHTANCTNAGGRSNLFLRGELLKISSSGYW